MIDISNKKSLDNAICVAQEIEALSIRARIDERFSVREVVSGSIIHAAHIIAANDTQLNGIKEYHQFLDLALKLCAEQARKGK